VINRDKFDSRLRELCEMDVFADDRHGENLIPRKTGSLPAMQKVSDEEICELRAKGYGSKLIAKKLGYRISEVSVRKRLKYIRAAQSPHADVS
jgi:hypothetical protein